MRGKDEIIRTGLLREELEEIKAGGPLTVRCAAVESGKRCLEIFDVTLDVELVVYSGSCPKHGPENFCITIQGTAGVAAFLATDLDRKALEASKASPPPAEEPLA